jgi:hypothetical protein
VENEKRLPAASLNIIFIYIRARRRLSLVLALQRKRECHAACKIILHPAALAASIINNAAIGGTFSQIYDNQYLCVLHARDMIEALSSANHILSPLFIPIGMSLQTEMGFMP